MDNQATPEPTIDQTEPVDTNHEQKPPKMTRKQTKTAIITAIKHKQISKTQGNRLLLSLGFGDKDNTKKTISDRDRSRIRKQQKKARKANRK